MTDPLQLARDAMSEFMDDYASEDGMQPMKRYAKTFFEAMAALDAAIAQRGDPVAWRDPANTDPAQSVTFFRDVHEAWPHIYSQPLYTAPPARVPLTPDELADKCEAWLQSGDAQHGTNVVDAYEAGYRDCERAHGITGA